MRINKENYREIAIDLSIEDADIQAMFLNTLFKSIEVNCGDEYRTQVQLCSIFEKLKDSTKKRINFLYDQDL